MASLFQFLNGRKTTDKATHLSMIQPTGKYYIHGADVDVLMDLYCSESPDSCLGLLEATSVHHVLPVLVDADIKKDFYRGDEIRPLYEPALVLRLLHTYQKVLAAMIPDISPDDLLCVVLEKQPYVLDNERTGKSYLKHGFHLHFPRCFLNKMVQEKELIPRVKMEWKKNVAQNEFSLSIDTLIDRAYCKGTAWLLYRSRKADTMDPYMISYLVDGAGVVQENNRLLLDIHVEKMDRTPIDLSWDNLDYHLPRILSISPHGRERYTFEIRDDLPPIPTSQSQNQNRMHQQIHRMNLLGNNTTNGNEAGNGNNGSGNCVSERDIEIVDKLLSLLSKDRAVDRNDWMEVGWVLFNIFRQSEEGLQRWIRFSEKSPENFSLEVCRYEWSKMCVRNLTIGTLKFMAKEDDPQGYSEIMKEFQALYYEKAMKLGGSHNDLAKALFEKYEHEYICASIKDKIWYEYSNHVWNRIDEGYSLRSKISNEVVWAYEAMAQALVTRLAQAEEDEQATFNKKLKNCLNIISLLKSAPYKSNIMKECMEVFYQPNFMKELDTNPFLFTFKNGVYDIATHSFREGRPSDKNAIKAPIRYRDDLHHDSPEVVRVQEFFEKIFPDRSVRDYFMTISSHVFMGGNHAKIFQVWTGEGDNGKSVTQALFEKMLGPYSIKLPTALIIGKRTQSSAACPELVRAGNGVRFAMLQEPDGKDVINVGILKELSGNDSFFARGLYKEGCEITPMFKLVLICNDPPKLPYNDKATWNRVRVIPFESFFTDKAPTDPEEQLLKKTFPKDTSLQENVGSMAEAFAWMLLEHMKTHPKIGEAPAKVMMATANYRKKNDIYRQFVEDHVTRDPTSSISVQQCYNIFKEWFREGVPNAPLPCRDDFREYMTKILGDPVQSFWREVKIRSIEAPMEPPSSPSCTQQDDNDDDNASDC